MVESKKKLEKKKEAPKLFAIIRIRGEVGVTEKIATTMELLRLHKKHRCVIITANDNYMGMISKVKDYCTFGEIDEATVKELLEKRGRIAGDNVLTSDFLRNQKLTFETFAKKLVNGEIAVKNVDGFKQFFKLSPPRGGFERGGIKKPYSMHGALGYRGAEINKLVRKMI
jgi:large subunit ribosomal protein L30